MNRKDSDMKECLHYHYGNIPDLSLDLSVDKKQPFNYLWWYCAVVDSEDDITSTNNEEDRTFGFPEQNVANVVDSTDISHVSSSFHGCILPLTNDRNFSIPPNLF